MKPGLSRSTSPKIDSPDGEGKITALHLRFVGAFRSKDINCSKINLEDCG
jgi:hypothetical protein